MKKNEHYFKLSVGRVADGRSDMVVPLRSRRDSEAYPTEQPHLIIHANRSHSSLKLSTVYKRHIIHSTVCRKKIRPPDSLLVFPSSAAVPVTSQARPCDFVLFMLLLCV